MSLPPTPRASLSRQRGKKTKKQKTHNKNIESIVPAVPTGNMSQNISSAVVSWPFQISEQ